ncbi:unnamed protein product [Cyclocybe aegerita]|uniref:P-loop containing nucleoside triphosphate hydrolase protein n=1 Tax=Cyclocybe aegerita TaxID=1973307 RepID=A0A8S0X0H8_CYCAE|nr:unnamed protein product [Cyclocybe aegerita]
MDALKSLVQPLIGGSAGSSVVDGMKLVVLGGTVETARRVSSSAWSHFVNSFFLTAHFSEEDLPYDWLMLWLSRRPEWQRAREFETTTRAGPGGSSSHTNYSEEDADWDAWEAEVYNRGGAGSEGGYWGEDDDADNGGDPQRTRTRIVFQPTYDTTHTIFYRGHWLRVRRGRKHESGCEMLSISVVARSNAILKHLVLQAKKEYEAEAVHRIQLYFADVHGSWRWSDSRHKRPMSSIVLNPGVKEMLLEDARDFLASETWYADRGIPFRRGYLLHGVPGSGKSSLIHALAGALHLDIYVVSLSASWVSDTTLTTLMGRVPARCVLLLEDLDAAFVRSTNRDDDDDGDGDNGGNGGAFGNNGGVGTTDAFSSFTSAFPGASGSGSSSSRRRHSHHRSSLSPTNTLSLSGLLNALDGVAASEGRLLFATTNHLERLDPALSRPGRMDVWVEFKNASRWQAEALFRNFFPWEDGEDSEEEDVKGLEGIDLKIEDGGEVAPGRPTSGRRTPRAYEEMRRAKEEHDGPRLEPPPSLWSLSTNFMSSASNVASSASSILSSAVSSTTSSTLASPVGSTAPPLPRTFSGSPIPNEPAQDAPSVKDKAKNTIQKTPPRPAPLDKKTLAMLAKKFADGVPEDEFSIAGLQGCVRVAVQVEKASYMRRLDHLLRHKAQPEAAANGVEAWVRGEREMRERLQKEKEAREVREKAQREKRRKEAQEKEKEKKEKEKKEKELERVKALLAEKEKEEELEKMRAQLREKEKANRKKEKRKNKSGTKSKEETKDDEGKEKKDEKKDAKSKSNKAKAKKAKADSKPSSTSSSKVKSKTNDASSSSSDNEDASSSSPSESESESEKSENASSASSSGSDSWGDAADTAAS